MEVLKIYGRQLGWPLTVMLIFHFVNFFGTAHLFGYGIVFLLLLIYNRDAIQRLDREFFWILLFSITYTLFDALGPNRGAQYLLIQLLFPAFFYLLGKLFINKNSSKKEVLLILIGIGALYSITSLLSVGTNLLSEGFKVTERSVPNFWTGKATLATGLSGYLIYNLCLAGILLTSKENIKGFGRYFLAGLFVISLLCSFRLGSRTNLVVTALGLIVGFGSLMASQNVRQNIRLLFGTTLVIFLVLRFVPFDLEADYLSVLGSRLQDGGASSIATAGNRTGLWEEGIDNLFKSPLGWGGHHFAHNTWLDIARIGGILSLLFFAISNFFAIRTLIRCFKLTPEFFGLTTIFFLYFISTYLLFFGEPIILGNFYAVSTMFLLHGVLKGYWERFFNSSSNTLDR